MRYYLLPLFAATLLGTAACARDAEEQVCAGLSLSDLRPGPEQTIRVGETFTAEYRVGDMCYGNPLPDLGRVPVRWNTADSLVVRVDSVSGRVLGLTRGEALVWARYPDALPDDTSRVATIHVLVE